MKFLLDMGLAQSTARHLRTNGHDAVHLRDQGLQRLPDHGIVQKAIAEGRVILTHDLDFGRIVALSHDRVPSVITFRLADMRAPRIDLHLDNILRQFAGKLAQGALISVTDQAIRVRELPVP